MNVPESNLVPNIPEETDLARSLRFGALMVTPNEDDKLSAQNQLNRLLGHVYDTPCLMARAQLSAFERFASEALKLIRHERHEGQANTAALSNQISALEHGLWKIAVEGMGLLDGDVRAAIDDMDMTWFVDQVQTLRNQGTAAAEAFKRAEEALESVVTRGLGWTLPTEDDKSEAWGDDRIAAAVESLLRKRDNAIAEATNLRRVITEERDITIGNLRRALLAAGRDAGALLADDVSDNFLCDVPLQVVGMKNKLRQEIEEKDQRIATMQRQIDVYKSDGRMAVEHLENAKRNMEDERVQLRGKIDELHAEIHRNNEVNAINSQSAERACLPDVWLESAGTEHVAIEILVERLSEAQADLQRYKEGLAANETYMEEERGQLRGKIDELSEQIQIRNEIRAARTKVTGSARIDGILNQAASELCGEATLHPAVRAALVTRILGLSPSFENSPATDMVTPVGSTWVSVTEREPTTAGTYPVLHNGARQWLPAHFKLASGWTTLDHTPFNGITYWLEIPDVLKYYPESTGGGPTS